MNAEDVALLGPCPACGAEPGYWCTTYRPTVHEPGRLTTWLHASRLQPAVDLWMAARREGGADALEGTAYALECAAEGQAWAERDGIPYVHHAEGLLDWLRYRAGEWRRRGY